MQRWGCSLDRTSQLKSHKVVFNWNAYGIYSMHKPEIHDRTIINPTRFALSCLQYYSCVRRGRSNRQWSGRFCQYKRPRKRFRLPLTMTDLIDSKENWFSHLVALHELLFIKAVMWYMASQKKAHVTFVASTFTSAKNLLWPHVREIVNEMR